MENQILDAGELQEQSVKLVDADKGKRFANLLVDYAGAMIFSIFFFFFLAMFGLSDLDQDQPLLDRLYGILAYLIYYVAIEAGTGGKSLGKIITRTRVIREDGGRPTFQNYLGRSFSRIIPFEPFSFLGSEKRGWHDTISKTRVIDERKSVVPFQEEGLV